MEVIEHDDSFSPVLTQHVIEIVQSVSSYDEVFSISDTVNKHGGARMSDWFFAFLID